MKLQFLEAFCHKHGVLAAGNTDCNLISRLHKLIGIDSLGKFGPDFFLKFLAEADLHILSKILILGILHHVHKPGNIAALQAHCIQAFFRQILSHFLAVDSAAAADDKLLRLIHIRIAQNFFWLTGNCALHCAMGNLDFIADINDLIRIFG